MAKSKHEDDEVSDEGYNINKLKESLLTSEDQQSRLMKILTKVDFFSFLPVPKDVSVSTKQSIVGSIIFIVLFFVYISIQFYIFVTDNPPKIETYSTKLDQEFYDLPRVAVAFQQGQYLEKTDLYSEYFNFTFTKEIKGKAIANKSDIGMVINNPNNAEWLSNDTTDFYKILRSPSETMRANGLLYSTSESNYTKLSISMCNVDDPGAGCAPVENISSLAAKGRIFLFIEDTLDPTEHGSKKQTKNQNRFLICNFFLMPNVYKRVTVIFSVVKTTIYPDYFTRFHVENYTKLTLDYVTEQTSNTTINDIEENRTSLQMLGVTFQLAPQIVNIRYSYDDIFDQVAKWGAFFNVLFTLFALFFLSYNRRKFYQKNPDWDRFKEHSKNKYRRSRDQVEQ